MQTDNNTASGIINGAFNQAGSKAIDMRYYCVIDGQSSTKSIQNLLG